MHVLLCVRGVHVSILSSSWTQHPPAGGCVIVAFTRQRDPHSGPGASAAAEGGSSPPSSTGSGKKLSRLMSAHPR